MNVYGDRRVKNSSEGGAYYYIMAAEMEAKVKRLSCFGLGQSRADTSNGIELIHMWSWHVMGRD